MRKSTKVKKTKVSKPVASTRRLKKFDIGGGTNKLKEFTDPGLKGYPGPEYGDTESTTTSKVVAPVVVPVVAPVVAATSPKVAQVKKNTVAKTKLLPGGFKSEAQRKAYTESLRQKIKSGKSVDQLVKEGYGTKKGLSDLGLGKYSEGLDLKKKGQAKKAEGLALKNKAKNTDYKKQWNENLLNKAATNKNLTRKESTYIRQKYKGNTNILGKKTDGTSKEKLAYKNAGNQQFEKVKPEMRENLELAVSMTTPRGIAKQAIKKGGEFAFSKGAQEYIKNAGRNLSESQKLLGQGQKLLGSGTKKAADETVKKVVNETAKKVVSKTKDPIKGAKDLARNQRAKVDRIQKGGLEKLLKKSDKVVKSKKAPEPTVGGRTKSQVDAFYKRNKKAIDNDWAIIDSYRRGGKANTSKKTVAKVSVIRRGSNK